MTENDIHLTKGGPFDPRVKQMGIHLNWGETDGHPCDSGMHLKLLHWDSCNGYVLK